MVDVVKDMPSACTSSSLLQAKRLQVRNGGDDEHAGRPRNHPGDQPDQRREPALLDSCDPEGRDDESVERIGDQRGAEDRCRRPAIPAGQQRGGGQCPRHARRHHRPKPPCQGADARTGQQLPQIGDHGRDDQQARRRQGGQQRAQDAHGERGDGSRQCGFAAARLRLVRRLVLAYAAGMRFDLTDLRLFLAVAEAGSITHGAADAGLSLPAASERLRDMELSGGVRLL